jgi:hypothetical protein
MNAVTVESLSKLEPTLYEEDSFHFQQFYQNKKDWYIYDSHEFGISTVQHISNQFCAFHGKVPFPNENQENESFWSTVPLGVFRYKFLADMSFSLAIPANKHVGYIVSGVYWDNGFAYVVTENSVILQVKLFIDKYTKRTRQYPDKSYL